MDKFQECVTKKYEEIRANIRSGDILLCSGNSLFSSMIQKATNSIWSHVGFILRLDVIDRIMVLESVESIGVRAVTLSSYIKNYNGTGQGYPGNILIARHAHVKEEKILGLSRFATNLLGYPYNTQEIVRIAARISMSTIGVTEKPHEPERAFICSEYAYECFKSIGIAIDYDPRGFIAPEDFARSKHVKPLHYIENELSQYVKKAFEQSELIAG